MADYNLVDTALAEGPSVAFAPSPHLRWWLLIGAWAVALDLCLSATSLCIEFSWTTEPAGFTITDVLDWALLVPHIFVLLTFLLLSREAVSIGLWRSSIGVFASMWFLTLWSDLSTLETEPFGPWDALSTVLLVLGSTCVFVVIRKKAALFGQPAAGESPKPEPEPDRAGADESEKPKWGCLSMIVLFCVVRALIKGCRRLLAHLGIGTSDLEAIVIISVPLCVLCALPAFLVWFGICKIKLRGKLGPVAALTGSADLVAAVLTVILYVSIAVSFAQVAAPEPELNVCPPGRRVAAATADGFELVWKAMFAALFLSVRGRCARPERLASGQAV